MNTLAELFGSAVKVKLIRLFLFNEKTSFFIEDLVQRVKAPAKIVRQEIKILLRADFLKKNIITSKDAENINGSKRANKKTIGPAYALNERFPFIASLKGLLIISSIMPDDSLLKRFSGHGRIRLFIASGLFIQNWESRVDLLIVGDDFNDKKIDNTIKVIESELGKEINYALMNSQDFEYRMGIHDKLIRDILDYPHITLLDRIGIENK